MTYRGSVDFEPSSVEVDLGALAENTRRIRGLVGPDVLLYAALKCDAYGFGLLPVAHTLVAAGADALAVARVQDALELRRGGVLAPVLLYAGAELSPGLARVLEEHRLTPTVVDLASAETLSRHATRELPVFVKVDVGLQRIGVAPAELAAFAAAVARLPRLVLDGVYTHFHVPDSPPDGYLEWQFDRFTTALQEVERRVAAPRVRLAASSSVLRLTSAMSLNAVDPGRLFFGLVPEGPATHGLDLRSPLLAYRTQLLQVKELDSDDFLASAPVPVRPGMRLGVLPLGTGDGLALSSAADVLVRGRRAPLLEPISLEHCRVDLTDHPDAQAGDEVVLIGRQGDRSIEPAEVTRHRGLPLDAHVPINIRPSVRRVYTT